MEVRIVKDLEVATEAKEVKDVEDVKDVKENPRAAQWRASRTVSAGWSLANTRERLARRYQLVKSYAGNGRNRALDGSAAGMNGCAGQDEPKSALQADKVETSKNYQGKVKSPALQNRGQGTQIRPWATTVPPARW